MPQWNEMHLHTPDMGCPRVGTPIVVALWFEDDAPNFHPEKMLTPLKVVCKLPPTPTQKEIQGET